MPDRGYGPGGVLNPYALLWAVVIIGSLGLLGYAAMKVVGPRRGALLLGFIGGFMSSTAVTLTAAQAVRSRPDTATIFAAATCAAQAVMFLRTALLVTVLNAGLAPLIAAPAIAGVVTAAAVAVFLFLRADRKIESSELA